jgi:hypothetical protein
VDFWLYKNDGLRLDFAVQLHDEYRVRTNMSSRFYCCSVRGGQSRGSNPGKGRRFLSYPKHPDQLWSPHSTVSMVTGVLAFGVKRLGRDTDHSPPSSVEVKNEWSSTSVPLICLPGMDRNNFTFNTVLIILLWDWLFERFRSSVSRVVNEYKYFSFCNLQTKAC